LPKLFVAKSCIIDSSAITALLDPREEHHPWARATLSRQPLPWIGCEPALTEAFFLLHPGHARALEALLRGGHITSEFNLSDELASVLDLWDKYSDVPMSLADACLVRMTEILADPVIVTIDSDFKIYRRHSRQVVPCLMP
jgi:predicted nucleic acid-binding protein